MTASSLAHGRYAITNDGWIGRLVSTRDVDFVRYELRALPDASGRCMFEPISIDRRGVIMYTVDPAEVISVLVVLAAYVGQNMIKPQTRLPEQLANPDTGWLHLLEYSDELLDAFIQVAGRLSVRGYKATIIFYVLFGRKEDPGMFA